MLNIKEVGGLLVWEDCKIAEDFNVICLRVEKDIRKCL